MLESPCFVLSDAHLGPAPAEAEATLLALLERARTEAKSVVLNGDVFDFWFEWRHVMPRVGFRVLAALAALREAGVEVLWIAGNHDCWGGEILTRDVGVTYHVGPWRGSIARLERAHRARRRTARQGGRAVPAAARGAAESARDHGLPAGSIPTSRRGSRCARRTRAGTCGRATAARGCGGWRSRGCAAEPALQLYLYGHTHAPALERADGGGVLRESGRVDGRADVPAHHRRPDRARALDRRSRVRRACEARRRQRRASGR